MDEVQQLQCSTHHQYSGDDSASNNNKPVRDQIMQNGSFHDGSGHSVESGYNSYQSFGASSSVARSVLATIEEDNEIDCSFDELRSSETPLRTNNSILTPTTAASIEQISNFHLTTPNSAIKRPLETRVVLARKPTCQNLFVQRTPEKMNKENDYYDQMGTPVRSGRKCALGNVTPRKNNTSAKRKLSSFREKLYSDGDGTDLRSQVQLNDSLKLDCKQLEQEDISPIFHSKRRRNSVIDDLMRSSTPKTASFEKSSFDAEARENVDYNALQLKKVDGSMRKPLTLRKFQSFSPSKMHSYRMRGTVLQEQSINTNRRAPLRRQNALEEKSPRRIVTPSTITMEKSSLKPVDQKSEPAKNVDIVPVKAGSISALLDAPLLPLQSDSNDPLKETDLDQEITQLPSFDDFSFTPSKTSWSAATLSHDSVLRDAPVRRPVSTITSILDNESAFVDSLSIPITPISISKGTKLKRLSSRSLSSTKKAKSPGKSTSPKLRSTPVIPGTYRRSYEGVERLNILKRLNEQNKDALEILLDYLGDNDLVQVVAVSRGWRSIIESHPRVSRRLQRFLARESHSKENLDRTTGLAEITPVDCSLLMLRKVPSCDKGKELKHSAQAVPTLHRQPFSLCNSIDGNSSAIEQRRTSSVQKSPPVSPSKRKFRENQKIASHLKKSERLKSCPRCEKPSRVVLSKSRLALATANFSPGKATKVLEKSYTQPEASDSNVSNVSPVSPSKSDRIRRNLFSTSLLSRASSVDARSTPVVRGNSIRRRNSADSGSNLSASLLERKMVRNGSHQKRSDGSQCDYAVCSGKSCGFVFCIKCLCEYHPDSVCKDLAPNSPSKEDEPAHNVACSKQSRRSLLRLCK